jgi:hypothetical protein
MRDFIVGELWWPIACEYPGCRGDTDRIRLTDVENASLPEQSGPEAVDYIFDKHLGTALCDKHAKEDDMKNQKGFTVVELLVLLAFLVSIGIGCSLLYVGWHFISKFW